MNYKVEVIPDEPIVKIELYKHYSFVTDDPIATDKARQILNQSDEPMFMLMDVTDLSMSLEDVIKSTNNDARGEDAIFHHPKLIELLVVTRSKMIQLAVKGLTTVTFGNVKAKAFQTVDEARIYVRSKMTA